MSSFDYKRSTITKYRAGTANDPYIDITETKKVINNVIQLDEIPVSFNKVRINNMYEAPNTYTGDLTENEYRVDYTEGILHFHPSAEGLTLTLVYKGRGNHYISSARVWTKEQDGQVTETLEDIITAGTDAIKSIEELTELMEQTEDVIVSANTAASNAQTKANLADTKATYASTQGDYAKAQGDAAKTATTNANTATTNANTATTNANTARDNANTKATLADTKATFAQTQGDYAKSVGDSLMHKGDYSSTTAYVIRNIVYFNGSTYMCVANSTGNVPTNTTYWKKITNMQWQGTYSSAVRYDFGDVVTDSVKQTIYMCIADNTLNKPLTTTANWSTMVSVADAISSANTATSNANSARDNANTASTSANEAATNANTKAANAQTQAEYAKTQGDYAKSQGEMATDRAFNLVNKGTYNATTAYKPLNIVVYNGAVYQNIKESTGIVPTNTTYWMLMLQTTASVTWDSVAGKPNVETIEGAQQKANAAEANSKAYTDGKLDAVPITAALKPETSVITTDQAAVPTFKLWGNTLVNLLGADGNFETDSNNDGVANGWTWSAAGKCSLDAAGAIYGTKAQVITALSTDTTAERFVQRTIPTVTGKRYVLIGNVTIEGGASAILRLHKEPAGGTNTNRSTNGVLFIKFIGDEAITHRVRCYNSVNIGSTGDVKWDGVGVYEVSVELYNRIGVDINEDNIRDYLPHVDGKQHVQGVVVTKQGRNLLPPEPYDYNEGSGSTGQPNAWIDGKLAIYGGSLNVHGRGIWVEVVAGQKYTLNLKGIRTGDNRLPRVLIGYSSTSAELLDLTIASTATASFTPTQNRILIKFLIMGASSTTDPAYVYDMMLVAGDVVPASYVPAEPQRLILPVTLASVGTVRDEVAVKGNEAQLIKRVERDFLIDGNVSAPSFAAGTGFKAITMTLNNKALYGQTINAIRYDNFIFRSRESAASAGNVYTISTGTTLVITEENAVTGWVDAVNPNVSAIRALLNGWKATANDGTKYTGWVSLLTGAAPSTNTETYVAANKAPGWTAYATVDYVLATPEVKTVQAEGGITLHPGGNQISIATGIIQREKVVPQLYSGNYYINSSNAPLSRLSKDTAMILNIYKGAGDDTTNWMLRTHANGYGGMHAFIPSANFDPKADYYVTYIALDKYRVSANLTQIDAQYARGLSGLASELAKAAADGYETDSRQEFALMYIQAMAENNRFDMNTHTGNNEIHITSNERSSWNNHISDNDKHVTSTDKSNWNSKETTSGAQNKANAAESNAKTYADGLIQTGLFSTSTGSANTYSISVSPSPTLVAGLRVTVKIHVANTGASTLNVNGLGAKSIKKSNGNNVASGNLRANSVYTFVYDGTANFILQGEGGEVGTATAGDVLAGKTIPGEDGLIVGTMPNRGAVTITPGKIDQVIQAGYHSGSGKVAGVPVPADKVLTGTTIAGTDGTMPNRGAGGIVTPGTTNQTKAAGYYSDVITILGDPELLSGNIRFGINLFGVDGSLKEGLEYAQGSATSDANNYILIPFNAFTPRVIVLWQGNGDGSVNNGVALGRIPGTNPESGPLFYLTSGVAGYESRGFTQQNNPFFPGHVFISSSSKVIGTWNYYLIK